MRRNSGEYSLVSSAREIDIVTAMPDHRAGSSERVRHWDHVYENTGTNAVSWYQPEPRVSLELMERLGVGPESGIIDICGGASVLTDRLLPGDTTT
jgi:hypothetical protein